MEETNETTIAIQFMLKLNEFQNEIIKSMNYMREDIHELKDKVIDLRQELRDYKQENNKRWDENNKRWEKYEENRKQDRKELFNILHNYDIAISEQLGDPNAEKMRKIV